jgi:hypothetical protein
MGTRRLCELPPPKVTQQLVGRLEAAVEVETFGVPTGFEPVGLPNGPLIPKHLGLATQLTMAPKEVVLRRSAAKLRRVPCHS